MLSNAQVTFAVVLVPESCLSQISGQAVGLSHRAALDWQGFLASSILNSYFYYYLLLLAIRSLHCSIYELA